MIAAAMGWIGAVGSLGAYVMLAQGRWHSASLRYSTINGIGGLLGATASATYGAWPSTAANLLWSGVAVHSVAVELHHRRSRRIDGVRHLCIDR